MIDGEVGHHALTEDITRARIDTTQVIWSRTSGRTALP